MTESGFSPRHVTQESVLMTAVMSVPATATKTTEKCTSRDIFHLQKKKVILGISLTRKAQGTQ